MSVSGTHLVLRRLHHHRSTMECEEKRAVYGKFSVDSMTMGSKMARKAAI